MTHDELLALIEQAELGWYYGWIKDAVRAVVELHKPYNVIDASHLTYCLGCQEMYLGAYPCETIEAITKELL